MTGPAAKDVSPVGFLGLAVVLIGLIIGFVVVMEYDPEAADLRSVAEHDLGHVVGVDGSGTRLTVAVNAAPYEIEVQLTGSWVGHYDVGDRATVVWVPDDPSSGMLDADVPTTPRRAGDAIAPAVIFLLGAAMVTRHPSVLYVGFGDPDEGMGAA